MTAPARFTKADIRRAFSGAIAAGCKHVRVGIDPRGNLVVDGSVEPANDPLDRKNPLDRLLPLPQR
ncbi:MAG TPA: hypothetical protein VFL92_09490 [Sphingomonas sp.]|nr:hypothetical protein [Sphingomonas sp.]